MAIKGSAQNVAKAIQRKEREFQPSPTSLKKHALESKDTPNPNRSQHAQGEESPRWGEEVKEFLQGEGKIGSFRE
ncbi:MAG: hypothetical protein ACTHJ4_03735 [Candidatus Nucleicultricaceae bacterium]